MQYTDFHGTKISKLGLGNMRLPPLDPKNPASPIDWPQSHKMMAEALKTGITYYDTAYVYNNGESEKCLGEGMKGFDRNSFVFADKFFILANPDYKAVFEEQLKRLQTDHIDFYLLHCLLDTNIQTYMDSGAIDYFLDLKKQGKIKYLGFSSHAGTETLKKFASLGVWDFAQLQINYYDWLYGTSQQEYQILRDLNIPIVVMEPVRGGRLAKLIPEAEAPLLKAHPDWSIASWALRYVASLPGILTILSGMSNMAQLQENIKTFNSDMTFTEADKELLFEACRVFKNQVQVPCTACRYCTDGCPMEINIPGFMSVYNKFKVDGGWELKQFADTIQSSGKPADCISCGACTTHCPQKIKIPEIMGELKELLK